MDIYLCPSPELYHLYHRGGAAVIVVDIFRATTTMTTAFDHGCREIYPVASTQEAERRGQELRALIAAERNVRKCEFADLGNDPQEYSRDIVQGRSIVMTTTNGTRALTIAHELGASDILIGSFRNLSSTLGYLHGKGYGEVVVLSAGWQGQVSSEDALYAGALSAQAESHGWGSARGDMATMLRDLWNTFCKTMDARVEYLHRSEHFARLESAGFGSSVAYCLEVDPSKSVIGIDPQSPEIRLIRREEAGER